MQFLMRNNADQPVEPVAQRGALQAEFLREGRKRRKASAVVVAPQDVDIGIVGSEGAVALYRGKR